MADRIPSWKWEEDGATISGTLVGLRWQRQKEEYGGGNIPVITIKDDAGAPYQVYASGRMGTYGDPTGLWGALHRESPRYGDKVSITRGDLTPFTTKDGEQRTYREWSVNVVRAVAFADFSSPSLPDPNGEPPAPAADDDIPF